MSTFKVTAEQVEVVPHPNADLLEKARVGGENGYAAVVPKGVYQTGDWVLYIPEAGVLPPELIEELGLTGKLAGKDKNRVKTVRLRGEISQGIVCRPARGITDDLPFMWDDDSAINAAWAEWHEEEYDFAAILGIHKFVPPIPTHMSGDIEAAADLVRWIDIESVQRYPNIFLHDEQVIATEKIHGTACLFTLTSDGTTYVSSKGFGSQYQALQYSDKNLYWRAVETHNLAELAEYLLEANALTDSVGIFGEVFGKGVQDLDYGADASQNDTLGYRVFDIALVSKGERTWMSQSRMHYVCASYQIPTVPQIYAGPYDFAQLFALAQGTSTFADHVREGLVVRADPERRSEVLGGRAIGKIINPDYLTRKGGTEYE